MEKKRIEVERLHQRGAFRPIADPYQTGYSFAQESIRAGEHLFVAGGRTLHQLRHRNVPERLHSTHWRPHHKREVTLTIKTLESSTTIQPGTCESGWIKAGQFLRVTDIEGGQVADFVAFKENDPTEYLDCLYTNWANGRWKWNEGATIFTNHMSRMWVIEDDKTGVHFTGGGFCSNDARRLFDPSDTTKGCRDRLQATLLENGIEPHFLQSTSCFNIFMNVEYAEDGTWPAKEPVTKAGDYIELRAEMDIFWALSVCIWPFVNAGAPSPLRVETYR